MKDLGPRGPGGDLRPREPPRGPRGVMRFEKTTKYMKHAFCGLIHNFTCMNSNLFFSRVGPICATPLEQNHCFCRCVVSRAFHVRGKKVQLASQPVSQAGRPGQPTRRASKAASQPAQSVQPASQQASQPASPASHPASQPRGQTTSPASPAGRLQETSKKLYTDSIMCSTCV